MSLGRGFREMAWPMTVGAAHAASAGGGPLLAVSGLNVEFPTRHGTLRAATETPMRTIIFLAALLLALPGAALAAYEPTAEETESVVGAGTTFTVRLPIMRRGE